MKSVFYRTVLDWVHSAIFSILLMTMVNMIACSVFPARVPVANADRSRPTTTAAKSENDREKWARIVLEHLDRYPTMEIVDLYKLVHQATFGNAHFLPSPEIAGRLLEEEIAGMAEDHASAVIEDISPDERFVRIYLGPFLFVGGTSEALLDLFLASGTEQEETEEEFLKNWRQIEELARAGVIPFPVNQLENFLGEMAGKGFPSVHHSENYRRDYHPHYRVIRKALILPKTDPAVLQNGRPSP